MVESLFSLFAMSILLIGAPGPAAMLLTSMGSSHQIIRALPLVIGLVSGVVVTGLLTSYGIVELLERWPNARQIIQIIGGGFIVYIALKMLLPVSRSELSKVNFGYATGLFMNLLNPKAYATFAILVTGYLPVITSSISPHLVLAIVSAIATVIVAVGWLLVGRLMNKYIRTRKRKRNVRVVFSFLTILFVIPMLISF